MKKKANKNKQNQDLEKLRDEQFKSVIELYHSDRQDEAINSLFKAITLSNQLGKLSKNYSIYIEYDTGEIDENGDEITWLSGPIH